MIYISDLILIYEFNKNLLLKFVLVSEVVFNHPFEYS